MRPETLLDWQIFLGQIHTDFHRYNKKPCSSVYKLTFGA
jgi:hypothetical protein